MISQYAASQAALEHLTRCWALELVPGPTETGILAHSGLAASIIAHIKEEETERVPLGRRGTSEEVAAGRVPLACGSFPSMAMWRGLLFGALPFSVPGPHGSRSWQ
jgi:NAD(P)-dependent dehydrogenase (short-subunit alcohol dehydrogenase family)